VLSTSTRFIFVLPLLAFFSCRGTSEHFPLEGVQYRWDGESAWSASLPHRPPSSSRLHVKGRVPRLAALRPTLSAPGASALRDAQGLAVARLSPLPLFPLEPDHLGAEVVATYEGLRPELAAPLPMEVAELLVLLRARLEADAFAFAVASAAILLGLLMVLAPLARSGSTRAPVLGLAALASGLAALSGASLLRLFVSSELVWTWVVLLPPLTHVALLVVVRGTLEGGRQSNPVPSVVSLGLLGAAALALLTVGQGVVTALVAAAALVVAEFATTVLLVRAWKKGRSTVRGPLWGFLGHAALSLPLVLQASGLTAAPGWTMALGTLLAFTGVAMAIDRRTRSLRGQLAASVADAAMATEEVKHQVAARSRDLSTVMSGGLRVSGARSLQPGERFDDRYQVEALLGEGGMGAVYEVTRLSDGHPLALKVLRGEVSAEGAGRFAREAEIAARLDHPNLVRVVDVGVDERSATQYLVMELIDGASLAAQRERFGDARWALPILEQLTHAVAYLHAEGVVHRDLKPDNVLLTARGEVRLGDFGISRRLGQPSGEPAGRPGLADATSPSLTRTGAMMGTPLYMAPELAMGSKTATSAADVFALGVIAHELLTGSYPWASAPIHRALQGRAPRTPPLWSIAAPQDVLWVLARTLSPNAEERPSAEALLQALQRLISSPLPSPSRGGPAWKRALTG